MPDVAHEYQNIYRTDENIALHNIISAKALWVNISFTLTDTDR